MGLICVLAYLAVLALGPGDDTGPLTVGRPAPPLKVAAFLAGEPLTKMSRGSVYVIEFSGIQCVPCIRAMPHLTALQRKHPAATFISIYAEEQDAVRDHLTRHQAEIGYRVALDDKLAMSITWQQAAEMPGIPTVFLVAKDGTIAWIGAPDDLDAALIGLDAGSIDPRLERTRLAFGQAQGRAFREWQERQDRSRAAHSQLSALIEGQKWAEAVAAAERGALDHPEDAFGFHETKVLALAADPNSADRAVEFASRLSAMMTYHPLGDLGKGKKGTFDADIAEALINGGRGNDDPILTEAAAFLIDRADAGLGLIKDEEERAVRTKYVTVIAASLDIRRKHFGQAADRLRRILDLIRARPCPETTPDARRAWEGRWRVHVAEVEDSLRECTEAEAEAESRRRP